MLGVGVALKAFTLLSTTTWASLPESKIVLCSASFSTCTMVTLSGFKVSTVSNACTWVSKHDCFAVAWASAASVVATGDAANLLI